MHVMVQVLRWSYNWQARCLPPLLQRSGLPLVAAAAIRGGQVPASLLMTAAGATAYTRVVKPNGARIEVRGELVWLVAVQDPNGTRSIP